MTKPPKTSPKATKTRSSRKTAANTAEPAAKAASAAREGTKQAKLIEMLRRPEGATIAQVVDATGWQAHTVRGAMAGALKKRLGLAIISAKPNQGERVYRIA